MLEKTRPYTTFEGNFQMVMVHTDGTDPVVNTVLRIGDGDVSIEIDGTVFRKTNATGTEVGMLVEVYEMSVPVTGGVPYSNTFSVNKQRVQGGEGSKYSSLEDDGTMVVDLTGANILFRERGGATKSDVNRSTGLNIRYNLKPNTDYLIRSTVTDGNSDESASVLIGRMLEV